MTDYSELCEDAKNLYDPNDNFLLMKMHELEPKFEYKIWNIKSGKTNGKEWKLATFFYPFLDSVVPRKVFLPNNLKDSEAGSKSGKSFSFKQLDSTGNHFTCLGFHMS